MPNEQKELDEIRRLITRWVAEITLSDAGSYFDINKIAEGISQQLLNLVYDYNLVDLNEERINYPGIDLGDRKAGIAFQVTARTDLAKIRDSLDKYVKYGLDKDFPAGVRFLILNEKKIREGRMEDYASVFDHQKDIIYAHSLINSTRGSLSLARPGAENRC